MALAHIVVLSAALLTLLLMPSLVVLVARADERTIRRYRAGQGRASHALDRQMAARTEFPGLSCAAGPPIEQIAFDLRRLDRQRRSGPTRDSERWLAAVERAYDDRLCLACHRLGLDQHLQPLEGLDRDLERLRMEASLQAAGLALRP